jgi:methionyl-tRNA formyltransferase
MEVGTLKVKGKKMYVKCQDKLIRVESWRDPSKKELPCGVFIATNLRGKEENWPKFV